MKTSSRFCLLAFSLCAVLPATCAANEKSFEVIQHWKVGGTGGWDLLAADPDARRLYVSRSDRVIVLDEVDGKPVGEIAHTDGVHGVALAPDLGRGFTSNGKSNSVSVFDLRTLDLVKEVKVEGENPDAILYDVASHRVFVFNGRSANASVVDARTLAQVGKVALGGKPELTASDGHGRVYVNIEDRNELAVIDSRRMKVVAHWALASCEEPTGLALDVRHHRLFSVCQNRKMIVTDSTNGRQVAIVPIGDGPDGAAFDPASELAFSSNGEGTLTVVHEEDPEHFIVVENVATLKSARTLALDEKTHRLFLPAAQFGAAPAATPEQPHPRPPMVPDTFEMLVVGRPDAKN